MHSRKHGSTLSFPCINPRLILGIVCLLLLLARAALAGTVPGFAFSIDSARIPGGINPASMAIDGAGNIYVASYTNVFKLAPNGNFLGRWGATGSGPGQFALPGPMAFDQQNNVYMADSDNNRVEKFNANGNFITAWGSYGTAPGQFDTPDGVAVDGSGRIYVADAFNNRIEVFTGNGGFLSEFGSTGTNGGQFSTPGVITIDSSNNLYVVDTPGTPYVNFRVQKLGLDGTFQAQWPANGPNPSQSIEVAGITTDPSKNVYIADAINNVVQKFSTDGTFLGEWGSNGSGPGQFNSPMGVVIDASGNYVYVGDFYNQRVDVFAFSALAPIVFQSPTNQIVPAGITLTLEVGVFGAQTLAYQWQFNGTNVSTGTNLTLVISNAPLSASGIYGISVTNTLGAVAGSNAVVTVLPVVIFTLPATNVSATGAVLQGSATLGPNPSSVWFDWGTDTNYGNISGLATLDANSSLALSQPLTNLSSAFVYHYRLTGSNSLGVAHGQDAQFQVGLKPSLVTLPVTPISAASVSLNASVNPEALDTSVFFRWGTALGYGHNTFTQDIGSGVTPLTVQSAITGLAAGTIYHAQAVASNSLGLVTSPDFTFIAPPWFLLPAPTLTWSSLASSADGSVLAAAINGDRIYVSTNSGVTWATNNSFAEGWQAVTVSADGSKLAAVAYGGLSGQPGPSFFSTNRGITWIASTGIEHNWAALACSGDGTKLAGADAYGGLILTSTNSGSKWITNTPPVFAYWDAVASSANGQRLVAAAGGLSGTPSGPLFTSTNAGHSWTSNSLLNQYWRALACSADGQTLYAAVGGRTNYGPIYVSTNAGAAWSITGAPLTNWQAIACSADGSKLIATPVGGRSVYISPNSGLSWQAQVFAADSWYAVASSADGARLFATGDENIYTLQTTPAPRLAMTLAQSQLALSWIVPSAPFEIQSTSDLFVPVWSTLALTPVLNFSNLQYQVTVPQNGSAIFYRLASP